MSHVCGTMPHAVPIWGLMLQHRNGVRISVAHLPGLIGARDTVCTGRLRVAADRVRLWYGTDPGHRVSYVCSTVTQLRYQQPGRDLGSMPSEAGSLRIRVQLWLGTPLTLLLVAVFCVSRFSLSTGTREVARPGMPCGQRGQRGGAPLRCFAIGKENAQAGQRRQAILPGSPMGGESHRNHSIEGVHNLANKCTEARGYGR